MIGTAITKFGELEIARTGLTEAEAERAGIDVSVSTAASRTRAHYYPGGSPCDGEDRGAPLRRRAGGFTDRRWTR
ncbi:MAG: hypothetical protein M5U19_11935 [Microthrixaceae bacterium]|nr:hypothetical protein [Microthrixaceae bacterium]